MVFLSKEDSNKYLRLLCPQEMWAKFDTSSFSQKDFPCCVEFRDENGCRYYYLAKSIVNWMMPFSVSVLLITEYGIFPSLENLHLFQRVRLSYSESAPVFITPGHLFMDFESSDLITLLHLCMLFGWGGVIAAEGSKAAFFSHDGWIGLAGEDCNIVSDNWRERCKPR